MSARCKKSTLGKLQQIGGVCSILPFNFILLSQTVNLTDSSNLHLICFYHPTRYQNSSKNTQ